MTETGTIRDTRLQLLELSETIEELNKTTKENELAEMLLLEERWEQTKDKSLSNATKRDIVAKEDLARYPDYVEMKAELDSLRKAKARMEIELDFMLRAERKERLKVDISIADALTMLLKKV